MRNSRLRTLGLQEFRVRAHRIFPRCQWCNRALSLEECTVDHITPTSQGGKDELNNLCLACKPCNSTKSDKTGLCPQFGPQNWASKKIKIPSDTKTAVVWVGERKMFIGTLEKCKKEKKKLQKCFPGVSVTIRE